MHYYKFNVAGWAKDTSHLSLKEEAIYLRLVNFYYDHEKPIPLKTHLVLRKLRMADESETVDLILDEFFTKTKDGWIQNHCEKLIGEYQKMAERNKKNAKLGGRPKINNLDKASGNQVETDTNPKGIPNQELETNNQELETNNQELETNKDNVLSGDKLLISLVRESEQEIIEEWNSLQLQKHRKIVDKAMKNIVATYKCYKKEWCNGDPVRIDRWVIGYVRSGIPKLITEYHRTDGVKYSTLELFTRKDKYESLKNMVEQ